MSHPLPPSITAGVIVFLYNVSSLVVFTLVSLTSESTVTFVSAVGIFLCLLLVIPIREEYLRLDSEHTD